MKAILATVLCLALPLPGWSQDRSTNGIAQARTSAGKTLREWIELLDSGDGSVRLQALQAIESIGGLAKATVPTLLKRIKDDDPEVRACAALALGWSQYDDPGALESVLEALKDKDARVRKVAVEALS